jgi:hypothetical protein
MGPGVTPIIQKNLLSPGKYSQAVHDRKYREMLTFTPAGDPCRTAG